MTFLTSYRRKPFALIWGFVLALSVPGLMVVAEEPWEFSPYRVQTWVYFADEPELNARLFEQVSDEVETFSELLDRSGWRVSVERSPVSYAERMQRGVDQIELTDEVKMSESVRDGDRIAFVSVKKNRNVYTVSTRQLDCQLHLWGPMATKTTRYPSRVPRLIFESVRETLVPVARIEKIEGKFVRLRVRASQIMKKISESGTVVDNPLSPAWVNLKTIFRPVVRRNDKQGNIMIKDGIKIVEWTFLNPVELVKSPYVKDEAYLKAEIHGAKRSPLAGRTNRSQKKFAVVVRPTLKSTTLTLLTRDKTPKPIPDKKIYVKYPGEDSPTRVLGQTNRKGEVIIEGNQEPLHLVYIKSGERRILARLPVVPGYFAEQSAEMKDDKDRLRAEGVLAGFEFNFMDLTIQRQVYDLRIRSALTKKKPEEARRLFEQFSSSLESRDSFMAKIQKEKRLLNSEAGDKRQKELIDQMFSQFQILVQQKMKPSLASSLDKAILNVEKGGTYQPPEENLNTTDLDKQLKEVQEENKGA